VAASEFLPAMLHSLLGPLARDWVATRKLV